MPSTQRTSQPRFFPPAPWHLPPAPASPSFLPTRLALWRPPAGRTASLRGWWAWGGSGGGFRGPTSPRRFERKRGWPRWSRATGRLSDCSRSGGVCRTRPDGEEQREKFYFIYIYFLTYVWFRVFILIWATSLHSDHTRMHLNTLKYCNITSQERERCQ